MLATLLYSNMQTCNILILLLSLVNSNSAAFSDRESNNVELNNAMKYLERVLKQQESKEVPPLPSPDYVVDQQEEVPKLPDYFVDQQESPNEDQDESSPTETGEKVHCFLNQHTSLSIKLLYAHAILLQNYAFSLLEHLCTPHSSSFFPSA